MSKKPTIAQLKKKLDKVFSLWVRNQGANNGYNICYTCNVRLPIGEMQAAHFISRTHSSTRFDPINVRPSCFRCNIWLNGNMPIFAQKLLKELGEKGFNDLIKEGKEIKQWSIQTLQELIRHYEERINRTTEIR